MRVKNRTVKFCWKITHEINWFVGDVSAHSSETLWFFCTCGRDTSYLCGLSQRSHKSSLQAESCTVLLLPSFKPGTLPCTHLTLLSPLSFSCSNGEHGSYFSMTGLEQKKLSFWVVGTLRAKGGGQWRTENGLPDWQAATRDQSVETFGELEFVAPEISITENMRG